MKRLITAITFLVFVVIGCFASYFALSNKMNQVCDRVSEADAQMKSTDYEQAFIAIEKARKNWESEQSLLGALVRHDEIDQIDNLFARAVQTVENHNREQYDLESSELKNMLRHIPEMEAPTFRNIF